MLIHRTRCLFLQQLLLLLSISATACLFWTCHGSDEAALLAFKAKISCQPSWLASWNRSSSYCSWEGVTCGSKRHRPWPRVVALDLSSQGLHGTISPAISNLTFLRSLNLSYNSLQGGIPPGLGSLRRLQSLDLAQNMLTGVIPSNISRCSSLRLMRIGSNKGLHGSIPGEIGNMPSLTMLGLYNNSHTGTIPASFGNLSRLTKLSLKNNYLEGSIPAGIGNSPYLSFLQLTGNDLSGLFPPSLYNLSSLYYFYAAGNRLHGCLPSDLGQKLPSIQEIGIGDNRFTGALPLSFTNLSRLQSFSVEDNSFTGIVPSKLSRLRDLNNFLLDGNMFEANNDEDWEFIASLTNCSRLQALGLGHNRFAGKLPRSLVNLSTSLQSLSAPRNKISGVIPSDIGKLASLQQLSFGENLLSGVIPESIGKLTRLKALYLNSNNFSGRIPSSIANLTESLVIDASSNNLEGPIPPSIKDLANVIGLNLSFNKLTSLIPSEITGLSSISQFLDVSYNMLEGPLPLEVGNLVNLEQLILSGNKLSGEIPDTIGNCRVMEILAIDNNLFRGSIPATLNNMAGLTLLNLTSNKLNGSIPSSLASITNLQELYLADNNLTGSIPELLGNSTSLIHLDLSFNNLQGNVPAAGVFSNLTGLSVVGNSALCGGIPQLHLPRCRNSNLMKNKKSVPKFLRIQIPTTGALLLLFFLVLAGFLFRKFKTAMKNGMPQQCTETDQLPIIPYNDILKGTAGFSKANVLGKGRYGIVYKGTLENGTIVRAVKVFNLQLSGSYKSFHVECEALRRVKHRCLLKIISCCSSIDHQGQDFRALVFEFMPNRSLDRWIHSNLEGQNIQGALSLSQRLDIAVDIVDALDYLHNGCEPPVIHCDLKPSNILLNQDMRACIGDFGIARVIDEGTREHHVNSRSTIGMRGSIGYIAPEYGEGLAASTSGDVFSLGIILIEMFTGKNPTDDMFRDGVNLHYYAEAALPDMVMDIADANMLWHDEANYSKDTTMKCLTAVIHLGVLCSKQLPTERMSVSDAAAEMHAIRDRYLSTQN